MDISRHCRHYLRKYNLTVVLSKIGKNKLKNLLKLIDILYNISTKKEKRGKKNERKKIKLLCKTVDTL